MCFQAAFSTFFKINFFRFAQFSTQSSVTFVYYFFKVNLYLPIDT